MTADNTWDKFVVRINVSASLEKLYQAWAVRSSIESWFLRESTYVGADGKDIGEDTFAQPGDSYTWRWFGYPDDVVEYGEIIEANGKDRFGFSFGKAGICYVRMYTEAGENIVELVQDSIPTDETGKFSFHVGCKTGWTFYLANMKSIYEGGIDLRNKSEALQQMLNA